MWSIKTDSMEFQVISDFLQLIITPNYYCLCCDYAMSFSSYQSEAKSSGILDCSEKLVRGLSQLATINDVDA